MGFSCLSQLLYHLSWCFCSTAPKASILLANDKQQRKETEVLLKNSVFLMWLCSRILRNYRIKSCADSNVLKNYLADLWTWDWWRSHAWRLRWNDLERTENSSENEFLNVLEAQIWVPKAVRQDSMFSSIQTSYSAKVLKGARWRVFIKTPIH